MSEEVRQDESDNKDYPESQASFPSGFVEQLKATIFKPDKFFKDMPAGGGYAQPAIFLVITSAVHAIPSAILHGKPLGVIMEFIGGFFFFAFLAGVLFGLGKMFGGQGSFQGTFRVAAYSSGPKMITWIPWIGQVFGLYSAYLLVVGMQHVHKIPGRKAAIVVAIPIGVLLVFSFVISMIAKLITHH